jgi:hypothetical protein
MPLLYYFNSIMCYLTIIMVIVISSIRNYPYSIDYYLIGVYMDSMLSLMTIKLVKTIIYF